MAGSFMSKEADSWGLRLTLHQAQVRSMTAEFVDAALDYLTRNARLASITE